MRCVFKPFWSLLTKRGEAYVLIVFKRVLMGGCIILPSTYNSCLLIHLVLWVVTLKLDGRLLLFLLLCVAMINSAWSHSADVHFSLCISLSLLSFYMHNVLSSHFEDGLHKAKPATCICIQKQIIYMHIFRGSLVICMRTILTTLNFHILLSLLKTSTSLSSITKKGEIVRASSATPSWFWSIANKHGWGTNVFVRIAG